MQQDRDRSGLVSVRLCGQRGTGVQVQCLAAGVQGLQAVRQSGKRWCIHLGGPIGEARRMRGGSTVGRAGGRKGFGGWRIGESEGYRGPGTVGQAGSASGRWQRCMHAPVCGVLLSKRVWFLMRIGVPGGCGWVEGIATIKRTRCRSEGYKGLQQRQQCGPEASRRRSSGASVAGCKLGTQNRLHIRRCGAEGRGGRGGCLPASVQAVAGQALQDAPRHGRIRHHHALLLQQVGQKQHRQ